jgi:hypothetical protein
MPRRLFVIFAAVVLAVASPAQSANSSHTLRLAAEAAPPAATLADFAWLAGHWEGTGFGGAHVEEFWTPPRGTSMAGVFRLVGGDRAQVYEILALVPVGNSVEMRLKHFTRELKGWEQKDDFVRFRLVKREPHAAYFDGLTYRLEADGVLRVWLVTKDRDGATTEQEMSYRRLR